MKVTGARGYTVLRAVLVEVRGRRGYTQAELAARLKWSQSKVAKIEVGLAGIDPVECAAWGRACGMTVRAFFLLLARRLEAGV